MYTVGMRNNCRVSGLVVGASMLAASVLGLASCAKRETPLNSPPINQRTEIVTEKRPVTDVFHSVPVREDYRWLEDPAAPSVKAWIDAQNTLTRSTLDSLPIRDAVSARVTQILSAPVTRWLDVRIVGNRMLALKSQPPRQQPFLVVLESLSALKGERLLLDPATIGGEGDGGGGSAIDWFVPSPNGKLVAVSLSQGGTESGDVSIFDIETGKRVDEVVRRVHGGTAGGSLAWTPDSRGFYYTRYPREGERPEADMDFYMQVWKRTLGTPLTSDRYETGKEMPRIAEITVEVHEAPGRFIGAALATVQNGDGGEFEFHLRTPDGSGEVGQWIRLAKYTDKLVQASFGPDDAIYFISREGAPRGKLVRLALADAIKPDPLSFARVIIPEQKDTLVSAFGEDTGNLAVTESSIYVTYQLGGPSEIRVFDHRGSAKPAPKQLSVASVGGMHRAGRDGIVFYQVSYIDPAAWYTFEPVSQATTRTALATDPPVTFDGYEVVREMATSKDGTKIPVNIVRKKGMKLDSTGPALLTAYGGYGVNREPAFRAVNIALLERGFVWAEANIRGGGEFGETWHRQGALLNKQNCFDDFASAAELLISRGYVAKDRLAIEGGSNGGLLMGATLVQRPELAAAVVSHVGIYDMLRVELSANGAFNVPEFGTVKDAAQFKALYAYSPYHNASDGVRYPSVLLLTGMNDPRVDAMQSRKFAARLQAATQGVKYPNPVLLRTSYDSGHGMGTPLAERIAQTVDTHTFLCWRLGVK
jgi:prolyl oligopeptidase